MPEDMVYRITTSGNMEESLAEIGEGQSWTYKVQINRFSCENGKLVLYSDGFPMIRVMISSHSLKPIKSIVAPIRVEDVLGLHNTEECS